MKLELLDRISLAHGAHDSPDEGACIMEAIALIAEEDFSDHPECVCPAISDLLRSWNDGLPSDAERNRLLKPLALAVIGTRSTKEVEMRRRWMAFDWSARVNAPAWMDLTPALKPHAEALRGLPQIAGLDALDLCTPVLEAARAAAGDAAGAAARAAARAAAGDALAPTTATLQASAQDLVRRMAEER